MPPEAVSITLISSPAWGSPFGYVPFIKRSRGERHNA